MHGVVEKVEKAESARPPLKWAGGKRWQVPFLEQIWRRHSHRRLVEPFCGGLAVALGLLPDRALLNDTNRHLISFYGWLKRGLSVEIACRNNERLYYRHRNRFNALLEQGRFNTAEAASLFYYLNRTGYNGLCRFNRRGQFNVPFGRYKTITYWGDRDFRPYVSWFAHWEFSNFDVEQLTLDPADFVYADPPYDVEFTQYAEGGFSWLDQQRTARFLARHPGPVILVNQATPRIERLYRSLDYAVDFLEAPRRISCTGDRSPAREIVATRHL
jgi:DNA adenine methylase